MNALQIFILLPLFFVLFTIASLRRHLHITHIHTRTSLYFIINIPLGEFILIHYLNTHTHAHLKTFKHLTVVVSNEAPWEPRKRVWETKSTHKFLCITITFFSRCMNFIKFFCNLILLLRKIYRCFYYFTNYVATHSETPSE